MMTVQTDANWVFAAKLNELRKSNCMTARVDQHTLALFYHEDQIYAVDNRCPHMGFPLSTGSVNNGILTCYWHYARFDIASGGTFDPWADDVPVFPTELRGEEIWVDVAKRTDAITHQRGRLHIGLQRNISLVLAKAVITLQSSGVDPREPFFDGVDFGVRYQRNGWGQGLTILTCMMNLLPRLDAKQRARAMYHGLAAVANDNIMANPRHLLPSLPAATGDIERINCWFRQFIEVRDAEGAERAILTAFHEGASHEQLAEMLFAAATDHRFINGGHTLDFINKALEALDQTDWREAEAVLSSLTPIIAEAQRMEESNSWRYPIDLVELIESAFQELPDALAEGKDKIPPPENLAELEEILLCDDPVAISNALLSAIRIGVTPLALAAEVTYAAAMRIARFHTSNEFGDWDSALHTFTFANAVHQGLQRIDSVNLLRGVWDAAMSVYLDRFLNIPAARLPHSAANGAEAAEILDEITTLLNRQQQVNEAAQLTHSYLICGGDTSALIAKLGELLLREDRDFHTIQCLEAAARQFDLWAGTQRGDHILIAATRYIAAHSPTMRAQGQTFSIAQRLSRGENLFSDS